MPTGEVISVPGIEILDQIGQGASSTVYRCKKDESIYALKVSKIKSGPETTLRFRREATVLGCIHHPAIPKIKESGEVNGCHYIIMDYLEGSTLSTRLKKGPLAEVEIIRIATELAGALDLVHQGGLIHRDIKTQNILIDSLAAPKLIDFDLSATTQSIDLNSNLIVGTLAYSSPEQLGILRRPVDGRSDLYSLGVLLFECATGKPPFESTDARELIQMHATKVPATIRSLNEKISPALEKIILKLLNKDPDDRYQTGSSLMADLEKISQINENLSQGKQIELGELKRFKDGLVTFVGRENELFELEKFWNQTSSPEKLKNNLVLVKGESGSGKSRLVSEFAAKIKTQKTLVLSGKCSEFDPVPFAPLKHAIDNHIQEIKKLNSSEREKAFQILKLAVLNKESFLKNFSNELSQIIKDAPGISSSFDLYDQFLLAISQFVITLAKAYEGLVLIVDDVQWIDDSTLKLLDTLKNKAQEARLVVLCLCRNDQASLPKIKKFTDVLSSQNISEISINKLSEKSIRLMINSQLGNREIPNEFLNQIAARSDGNPFMVREYVLSALDAGLIRPKWEKWEINTEQLNKISLSSNAVQLVLKRLENLSSRVQHILSAATVIGSQFQLNLLIALKIAPEDEVLRAISIGLGNQVIEQAGPNFYRFLHDRIYEALYSTLQKDKLKQTHQIIAEQIEEQGNDDSDSIFKLAEHYLKGALEKNYEKAFKACYRAGRNAYENFANAEAVRFLTEAQRIASLSKIETDSAFEKLLGDLYGRIGPTESAIYHLKRAIERETDAIERGYLYSRLSWVHMINMESEKTIEPLKRGFGEIGKKLPQESFLELLKASLYLLAGIFIKKTGIFYETASGKTAEKHKLLMNLYSMAGRASYYNIKPLLMTACVFRSIYSAHRVKNCSDRGHVYSYFGTSMGAMKKKKMALQGFHDAMAVGAQFNDRLVEAEALLLNAWSHLFMGEVQEAEEKLRFCLTNTGHWLESVEYMSGCFSLSWILAQKGYVHEALEWLQKSIKKGEETLNWSKVIQFHPTLNYFAPFYLQIGDKPEAIKQYKKIFEMSDRTPRMPYGLAFYYTPLLRFYCEQGDYGEKLLGVIEEFAKLRIAPTFAPQLIRDFYTYQAYAFLERFLSENDENEKIKKRKQLQAALVELKKSITDPIAEGNFLVIQGTIFGFEGNTQEAERLFAKAEALARTHDSPLLSFEVARYRARLSKFLGYIKAALHDAHQAVSLAVQYDWPLRAQSLKNEFGIQVSLSSTKLIGSEVNPRLQSQWDALIQVNLAISRILDPDLRIKAILDEIVKILGAERAFLFLIDEQSKIVFGGGRDTEKNDLPEPKGYSTSVLDKVRRTGDAVLFGTHEKDSIDVSQSVVINELRSIIAVPLKIKEHLKGIVYLDSTLVKGIFDREDVEILSALANHIAIAIDTAQTAQLELEKKALVESISQLQTFVENAPVVLFQFDSSGILQLSAGQGQRSFFGTQRVLTGTSVYKFFTDRTNIIEALTKAAQGNTFSAEFDLGENIFEVYFTSHSQRTIAVAIDITERKRAEGMLISSSKMSALGEMAGGMAHEINTPLAIIEMTADQLQKQVQKNPIDSKQIVKMTSSIRVTVERIAKIIKALRSFARDASSDPFENANLKKIIEDTTTMCGERFHKNGITFNCDCSPEIEVECRPIEISQILLNLLMNSFDAVMDSGKPNKIISVIVQRGPDTIKVVVDDNGSGIPDHIRDKIFQPFFTTKEIGKGTGLGLSISKGIIEAHRGKIWFESNANGTKFTFEVPRRQS